MRYAVQTSRESGMGAAFVASAEPLSHRGREPRFLLASLGTVALAIVLAVALLQYHFAYGGSRAPSGLVQGIVVWIYSSLGFLPVLYFCVLALLWGGIAFVTGTLRDPVRRIAAAFLFAFSLAVLTAAMGGNGGRVGELISGRLTHAVGDLVVFVLLVAMTLMALLIATDWFFLRTFRRAPEVSDLARDVGVDLAEEDDLARTRTAVVPVRTIPARDPAERDARLREQQLMDRVLEEARQDLLVTAEDSRLVATAPPFEDEELVVVDTEKEDDLFAALDDEDLLTQAGEALERAWSDDPEEAQGIAPAADFAGAAEPEGEEDVRRAEPERAARAEPAFELPRRDIADLLAAPAEPDTTDVDGVDVDGVDVEDVDVEDVDVEDLEENDLDVDDVDDEIEEPDEAERPSCVLEPAPRVEIYDHGTPEQGPPVQQALFAEEPPDPDLLDRAAELVLTARRPMPSLLQRRLGLSFAEARQILDYLARLGALEPPQYGGAWRPLIHLSEWESRRA